MFNDGRVVMITKWGLHLDIQKNKTDILMREATNERTNDRASKLVSVVEYRH